MPLSDIVNVVITRQTQTVTEQGFGIPMILGTNVRFTDLIKFYSNLDEVALDFASTDPEYVAAQDIFSQAISPDLIAIGRRQVDSVNVLVETAMPGQDYILNVNGNELISNSSSTTTYSVATLNQDLVPGNRIAVSVNGTGVGTVTSVIDFDDDFVTGNAIIPTVNGVALSGAVNFTTDQATTMGLLRTKLAGAAGVASATITGGNQITVVFNAAGTNSVDSFAITGGASQTPYTISQGGFAFDTTSIMTMQNIATAIAALGGIASATVSPAPGRILTVQGPPATTATINSFVVTGGATQAGATIVHPLQPVLATSIAADIVADVQARLLDPTFPLTAVDNMNGTFTLNNKVPGVPFSLVMSTSIANPNHARVRITQVSPNQVYTVTLNGINYSYPAGNLVQDANTIVTGLVNLINAQPQLVDVLATNNNDGTFDIEVNNAINVFSISVTPDVMVVQKGLIQQPLVAVNAVADDLTAINNADSTWYALIATDRTQATVKSIADWVEARIKLFGTASSDPTIINVAAGTDTTSIAAVLNQEGYVRTFVMYHQDADFDYPEAAWFGRVLPLEPGSETWKFKTLNTISYSKLTTTQNLNALNKKANTYTFEGGVGITENGTVAQGEYIDIVRGIDWLTARIQEFVFSVLVNNPKIPYTDAGITVIQSEVLRALQLAINNNFIATDPEPIVTVPKAADIPPADKANRILRNVRFTATVTGAIHAVFIRGTVSV